MVRDIEHMLQVMEEVLAVQSGAEEAKGRSNRLNWSWKEDRTKLFLVVTAGIVKGNATHCSPEVQTGR